MDGIYRIHVKLGDYEFNGDGPESVVKEDYSRFMSQVAELLKAAAPAAPLRADTKTQPIPPADEVGGGVDPAKLQQVYAVSPKGIVSLRHLPNEGTNREADAAILILYGYRALQQQREVLVTRLNEGLRQSGINVDRLDRFMGIYSNLYMRGGSRSGGRYTLNNQGVQQAEAWLRTRFE